MLATCSAASSDIARFCLGGDVEAVQFQAGGTLADAEVDPTVRDQVERGDPLGGAGGMVVVRDHLADAVAEPDPLRAGRGSGEEDLGRRGVRVLVEEVVLDLPRVVEPEPVGEFHLIERVAQEFVLVVGSPGLRELMFVEDAELHPSSTAHQLGRTVVVAMRFWADRWDESSSRRGCSRQR